MYEALKAISPVDGRYNKQTESLSPYFSEMALMRFRVWVEVEYFIALCEVPLGRLVNFPKEKYNTLRKIYQNFTEANAQAIKDIEKITNHDVKAVEYFLKEIFDELKLEEYKEFIHFGLTSQDINNTAQPLSLKLAFENVVIPAIEDVVNMLKQKSEEWSSISMLAKTHGQPASPTVLGKEIKVFVERLELQLRTLKATLFAAKFGGATGNFNAHFVTYPEINWIKFGNDFVNNNLKLYRSQYTTQIEHYDNMAALFDNCKRINTILLDFSRDMWTYISMEYFKQKIVAGEVGSSAMPHKVNPIDYENAEGNLGIANAVFEHLSAKLPVSRLQRDLTDSTVSRNIGVPVAHTIIALKSLMKGLNKIILNQDAINRDLEDNWAVVAEALQTILRRENYPKPYETLKNLTRTNEKITQESIARFIDELKVDGKIKEEMKKITPFNYTGVYGKNQ